MRFAAFGMVGALGLAVQIVALELLMHTGGVGPIAATAAAVELSVLHNFMWHERWTWKDRRRAGFVAMARRLLQFHAANGLASIVASVAGVSLFTREFGWPAAASNVAAVAATGIVNFLALDRWIFATPRRAP